LRGHVSGAKQPTAYQKKVFHSGRIAFNRVEHTDPVKIHGKTVNRIRHLSEQDVVGLFAKGSAKPIPDGAFKNVQSLHVRR